MRYCIFSDVHSNWEAFEAVSKAFLRERPDAYLFLGDIVGYGADPHACITGLKLLKPITLIAGNHEWGVLRLLGIDYFNEYAAEAILYTKRLMSKEELDYLKSFCLICDTEQFTLVHGSLDKPAGFHYVLDRGDADLTLKLSKTPLCFVGHSHVAGFYSCAGNQTVGLKGPKISLEAGKKYLVNAGSVGQSRDGDPRASYVVYDDKKNTVEIKRVAYNIKKTQEKILKAGLPAWLSVRLAEGR